MTQSSRLRPLFRCNLQLDRQHRFLLEQLCGKRLKPVVLLGHSERYRTRSQLFNGRLHRTAPDVRNASVCIYQFSPQNATLTGSGANDTGCAGVLSDTCTAYLKEGSRNTTRSNSLPGDRCGTLSVAQEDLKRRDEACGKEKVSTIVASKLTKAPRAH